MSERTESRVKAAARVGLEKFPSVLPSTRADCIDIPRPCPYVSCRHNLYLEVTTTGGIKRLWPTLEPCEMWESCALDVAESGALNLEEIASLMNLTRERVRQVEIGALIQVKALLSEHAKD